MTLQTHVCGNFRALVIQCTVYEYRNFSFVIWNQTSLVLRSNSVYYVLLAGYRIWEKALQGVMGMFCNGQVECLYWCMCVNNCDW
jgi:hypothetical protein